MKNISQHNKLIVWKIVSREKTIGLEENCSEFCFETKCFEEHHIATSNQSLFGENIWQQKTLPLDTEIRTKTDHQPLLSITEGVEVNECIKEYLDD